MEILFFALILLAVPFVLPIVAWVSARRTRTQLETLLRVVESQEKEIDELRSRMTQLSREASAAPQPAQQPAAPAPAVRSEPISPVAPVARPSPAAPPAVPPAVVPPAPITPARPTPLTIPEPRVVERPFPPVPAPPVPASPAPTPPAPASSAPRPPDRPARHVRRCRPWFHRRRHWCLGLQPRRLHLRPAGRPRLRSTGRASSA